MSVAERTVDLTPLYTKVLANFAEELHDADPVQLDHLARIAEGNYRTDLGHQMRVLVNKERDCRTRPPLDDMPQAGPRRTGTDYWAVRLERWEQAGKVGDPTDPEYDVPDPRVRPGEEGGA